MKISRRQAGVDLARGESELARADGPTGVAVGTRDALYVPTGAGTVRVPWEQVEAADWDQDAEVLRVREVGSWGVSRPEYVLELSDPGRLLELVRERVTSSVLLQRHVAVEGSRGVRVIARRAPSGERAVTWLFEYDEGIDPDDPLVAHAAETTLAAARDDVGY